MSVAFDLASVGYSVHEHFVDRHGLVVRAIGGHARPTGGGRSQPRAPRRSRRGSSCTGRPIPRRANGTVIVEWLNVTGGLDVPALWMATHRHLVRAGFSWVGVSAQQVGIVGGGVLPGLGLLQTAPDRYASLAHPGDAYSFDMFTQVGRAVRTLLPERYGVRVERVVATGASQSAFHLTTYINAVDPLAEVVRRISVAGTGRSRGSGRGLEARNGQPERLREARRARLGRAGSDPRRRARARHGRAERDRRVRRAGVPPRASARLRSLSVVGGRGCGALRHVLLVRVAPGLRVAAGRAARGAHRARGGLGDADRGSDQLRAADALRAAVARSTPSIGGRRTARRRPRPFASTDDDGALARRRRSALPGEACARRGSTFRRAACPASASRAR